MGALDTLERYRNFFLTVAVVGTIGLFVPSIVEVFGPPRAAVEASNPAAPRLGIGDCIADTGSGRVVRSAALCDAPGALEVFHSFSVVADTYPGEIDLSDIASRQCAEAFDSTLAALHDTRPPLASATPTRLTWETAADRQVLCLMARSS